MLRRVLVVGLFVSALALAQRGGGSRGGGGGNNMPNIGFGPTAPFDMVSENLKLSKDQKKDFKTAMDDAQKEATPIHEQILAKRQEIADGVAGGKKMEDLAGTIQSEAALESKMAELELRTFIKIRSGLESDQQQHMGILFVMMRGIFSKKNWNSVGQ